MPTPSLPRRSSNKAAALIIVLAFVVLLTGLSVAYLSRSTTDRQLAHTSFHDTDADLLARSALDIVIGDFKQEIKNGSSPPGSGNVWIPSSSANVVPMYNPTPTPGTTPAIPNLIRRSVRSEAALWPDSVSGPAVGSRASAVNSTTDVSANGRSVSTSSMEQALLDSASWRLRRMTPLPSRLLALLRTRLGDCHSKGFHLQLLIQHGIPFSKIQQLLTRNTRLAAMPMPSMTKAGCWI